MFNLFVINKLYTEHSTINNYFQIVFIEYITLINDNY